MADTSGIAFERVRNFKPVVTKPRTKDLEDLEREELIALLPKSMQREISRIEEVFDNIEILTRGKKLVFPYNGRPIKGWKFPKEDLLMMFDPEEKFLNGIPEADTHMAYVNSDPVIWARLYLGINPRVYQIVLLRNPHPRKVLRLGRRCLTGDTPVLMADGTWRRIDEVKAGDVVSARHTTKNQLVPRVIIDQWATGEQEVYKITLSNGREIEATSNHQFLTKVPSGNRNSAMKAWRSIDEGLSVGMKLHLMNEYDVFGTVAAHDEAKLLGYLLTDGYIAGSSERCATQAPKFTSQDERYANEVAEIACRMFGYSCTKKHRGSTDAYDVHITDGLHHTGNACRDWIVSLGLGGLKSHDKLLPAVMETWDRESIALFINRAFAGDGCASTWNAAGRAGAGELSLTSCNLGVLEAIRLLLMKFGVNAVVRAEKQRTPGLNYKLRISDKASVLNFFDAIGLIYGKEDQSQRLVDAVSSRSRSLNSGNKNFRLVIIRSIEKSGIKPTYDITVDKDHSFIANGIVTHNCGKTTTIAMRMMWKSYVDPGNKSLLIAPMRSHIGVTWEMLNKFINESPELSELRGQKGFRAIEQPHHLMEFPNGSTIKCFTSGVRSASHADSIRGQEGDDIYIDEVDLMSADDFPAFISILRDTGRFDNNNKKRDKTMIVATTPNGRRDMLWKFVTEYHVHNVRGTEMEDRGFIDYFFPTHADFNYTPADDAEAFMMLSYNAYLHEVIADFGEEASGVFLKGQIERAIEHYPDGYNYWDVSQLYQRSNAYEKVVIGVDWDKFGAGTNIVVCAVDYRSLNAINEETRQVDIHAGRIRILYRVEIPRSMTTLHDGTEMIKNLNFIFNPDKLYIDRGYGENQVEDLFLSDKNGDPRTAGIWEKIRPVAFNEAIEIYDPITKLPIRRELKDHMVTQTVKWFEQDRIILNDRDYEQVPGLSDILKQFEQYLQIGISILGKPRYECGDKTTGDHALDAFMLCVLAAEQEWGDFSMPNFNIGPCTVRMPVSSAENTIRLSKIDEEHEVDIRRAHISRSDIEVMRPNLKKRRGRLTRSRL